MPEKIARVSRPPSWRHEFIRAHNYRCHYCNRFAGSVEVGPDGKPWHVDHKHALATGGDDAEENLALACERCNSLKHTLPYENFRRYARAAFWVGEPMRLDPRDLELLEATYLRTSQGDWMHLDITSERNEPTAKVISVAVEDPCLDAAEVIGEFCTETGRYGGSYNLSFVIEAHRLMPQLIAEIHLLRAELALLHSSHQASGTTVEHRPAEPLRARRVKA